MILVSILILFTCAAILLFFSFIFLNTNRYTAFLKKYTMFFGIDISKIPASPMMPDPLLPMIRQGQIGGVLFILMSIVLCGAGLFLLRYV